MEKLFACFTCKLKMFLAAMNRLSFCTLKNSVVSESNNAIKEQEGLLYP